MRKSEAKKINCHNRKVNIQESELMLKLGRYIKETGQHYVFGITLVLIKVSIEVKFFLTI